MFNQSNFKVMNYNVNPMQLIIWLQMAIKCADNWNCNLPKAEELCKELMKVTWDEDAELIIMEK